MDIEEKEAVLKELSSIGLSTKEKVKLFEQWVKDNPQNLQVFREALQELKTCVLKF